MGVRMKKYYCPLLHLIIDASTASLLDSLTRDMRIHNYLRHRPRFQCWNKQVMLPLGLRLHLSIEYVSKVA